MPDLPRPRYPVFVISKGRYGMRGVTNTPSRLLEDRVPFRLVVEASEAAAYRQRWPGAELLVLPGTGEGSGLYARNHVRDVSIAEGCDRHWVLDDNIRHFARLYRGMRIACDAGVALRVCEDFTDRYTNIGLSGLNYRTFVRAQTRQPFYLNCHVYSTVLVWNRMPHKWRLRYNEDTDFCLQVLSGGLCTVALNVFMADKAPTMKVKGGNTDSLYQGDGRLRMARTLERHWPGVVSVERRWGRPQHVVNWRKFDTPLRRRGDIDWSNLPPLDEYGMDLTSVRAVRAEAVRQLVDHYHDGRAEGGGRPKATPAS